MINFEPFVPPKPNEYEMIDHWHRRVAEELAAWANRTMAAAIAEIEAAAARPPSSS